MRRPVGRLRARLGRASAEGVLAQTLDGLWCLGRGVLDWRPLSGLPLAIPLGLFLWVIWFLWLFFLID